MFKKTIKAEQQMKSKDNNTNERNDTVTTAVYIPVDFGERMWWRLFANMTS